MRRAATLVIGALALAAAGWSALWFAGRGDVVARLDLERDRLAARGVDISHEPPRIGGFPFGYDVDLAGVEMRDAAAGLRLSLPHLTASADLGAPDSILYRFPQRFTVELAATPRAGGDAAPTLIEIEADDLVIEQAMAGDLPASIALRARSLLAVHAAAGQTLNAAIEFDALDASLALPQAASGAETALRLAVGSVDYLVTGESAAGAASRLEGGIARLGLTGTTDQRTPAAVLAVLAGAPGGGRLAVTLQTGQTRVAGGVEGAEGGSVALSSGTMGGLLRIEGGGLELSGTSENNRVEIAPADPAERLRGTAAIDRIETVYRSPLVPAERMDELALRIALGLIRPDDAFWQAVDPDAVLDRAPGEIILDLIGSARMLADEATGAPADAELGNITLRHADLSLLGAEAQLRGDLEFVQPANQPMGRLTLTLTRTMELVGDLARAGLIDIATAQAVTQTAANFTRAGETPQTLVSDLDFGGGEVRLNGDRLWIFGGAQ